MAKGDVGATLHGCVECGYESKKWLGRCPECGGWNTLVSRGVVAPQSPRSLGRGDSPVPLDDIDADDRPRSASGLADFDRVLGGGIVAGSVVLLGGEPGIGKSTLLLQVGGQVADRGAKVLYVSAEESARQIKLRADRLGIASSRLHVLVETSLERILAAADSIEPAILIVDSIQTIATSDLPGGAGSLSQVRETAARLVGWSKRTDRPSFLVGHVTKDGALAGPKTLEHLVDTVLYFEGERFHRHRIVRAHKNRFGPVHEIALFEMGERGLGEVVNPSLLLLSQRTAGAAGSVVFAAIEGTRPILVEVQALVTPSRLGSPRRLGLGFDPSRLALLLAVVEKRTGLSLADHDVYVNVAGGLEISEPAADLAAVAAVVSSFRNRPIGDGAVVFGEVGLLGEIRAVEGADLRLREAASLGFPHILFPAANAAELAPFDGVELSPLSKVEQLVDRVE